MGSFVLAAAVAASLCTATGPETPRRSHVTLSAKGSTPVASGPSDALSPRRAPVGSNTPKSSTWVATAASSGGRPRTGGAVTPKASVPVAAAHVLPSCAPQPAP